MKNILTLITILIISLNAFSQSSDELKYEELLEKNPFNKMYPKLIASESADYFVEWNKYGERYNRYYYICSRHRPCGTWYISCTCIKRPHC